LPSRRRILAAPRSSSAVSSQRRASWSCLSTLINDLSLSKRALARHRRSRLTGSCKNQQRRWREGSWPRGAFWGKTQQDSEPCNHAKCARTGRLGDKAVRSGAITKGKRLMRKFRAPGYSRGVRRDSAPLPQPLAPLHFR
jgi:hypothetical protein